jgi:hypothetical protein
MSAPVASDTRSPVEGEQRDRRVICCRAEPGGDQQGANLAAARADCVGLVVQAGTADVRGRRVIEQLLLYRVLVQPGDGAQAPGDGGAGAAPGLQVAGEALDVGAAGGEQGQSVRVAPGGVLAQVQLVGLAGQAAVPGQDPRDGEPLGGGEGGGDGDEDSGRMRVAMGYLRGTRLRPGLGAARPQQQTRIPR